MPLAYWIIPARRLVVVRGRGIITDREPVALRQALVKESRFDPTFREFLDLRSATDLALTRDGMIAAGTLNPYSPGVRRALVASMDVVYGMARMYQMSRPRAPDDFRVFRELESALRWLEVTETELPAGVPDWSS